VESILPDRTPLQWPSRRTLCCPLSLPPGRVDGPCRAGCLLIRPAVGLRRDGEGSEEGWGGE
jgi:hypothetical protein